MEECGGQRSEELRLLVGKGGESLRRSSFRGPGPGPGPGPGQSSKPEAKGPSHF
jgi:hypothetical protein